MTTPKKPKPEQTSKWERKGKLRTWKKTNQTKPPKKQPSKILEEKKKSRLQNGNQKRVSYRYFCLVLVSFNSFFIFSMLSLSHIFQGSMHSLLLHHLILYSFPVPLSYPEHFFPYSRSLQCMFLPFQSSLRYDALCTVAAVLCPCIVLKFTDHLCMTFITVLH